MRRKLMRMCFALVLLSSGDELLRAQQADFAMQVAVSILEQSTVRKNDRFYVQFELTSLQQVAQQGGGFAPVVVPAAAVQPIPKGWIELTLYQYEGGVPGQVSARIREYRVYEPGRGWRTAPLPIAWLKWNTEFRNGQLFAVSSADAEKKTAYGELTNYIASIFNVSPANVKLTKPDANSIPAADESVPQKPWRAHYGR